LSPLKGDYLLSGKVPDRAISFVSVSRTLQNFPLFHWLTVRENILLAAQIRRVPIVDLDALMRQFSAESLGDRYPHTLSGGERCRASLCQALIGQPHLMLLDEPFSGLDTLVKESIAGRLFKVARANATAVIFVTHDLYDAVAYADRVLVLGGSGITTVIGETEAAASGSLDKVRSMLLDGRPS
jgi:NitT/TauT family transport system ATP-binding protein